MIPTGVALLKKAGLDVVIEQGAGTAAGFPDAAYVQSGAQIAARSEVFSTSDIILQVRSMPADETEWHMLHFWARKIALPSSLAGAAAPLAGPE